MRHSGLCFDACRQAFLLAIRCLTHRAPHAPLPGQLVCSLPQSSKTIPVLPTTYSTLGLLTRPSFALPSTPSSRLPLLLGGPRLPPGGSTVPWKGEEALTLE